MSELARVHLSKSAPDAYKTLAAFSKTVGGIAEEAGVDARLKELVQIHVSQQLLAHGRFVHADPDHVDSAATAKLGERSKTFLKKDAHVAICVGAVGQSAEVMDQ